MERDEIIKRSTRAMCGITEREIVVPHSKLRSTVRSIRAKGFYVVADDIVPGAPKRKNVKIWFTTGVGL